MGNLCCISIIVLQIVSVNLTLIILAPIALLFLPIIFIEEGIRKQIKRHKEKKEEQADDEKKKKLGLHPGKGNDEPLFCPKCHSARLHY